MTRQPPPPLHMRLASIIQGHVTSLKLHTQQITTLQSQAAATTALVPGDWESVILTGGWSNLAGYIPAQARIMQAGMTQLVGHITGGTVTNGTVIGTLTAGYFNTVHAHTFSANAVTGAATAAHAGALGSTAGTLSDLAASPSVAGGTVNVDAGGTSSFTSAWAAAVAADLNAIAAFASELSTNVNAGTVLHSNVTALTSGATATAVNMNSPTITLSTAGVLTIQNVDPNVTTLSFSELIPLITA